MRSTATLKGEPLSHLSREKDLLGNFEQVPASTDDRSAVIRQ